MQPRKTTRGFTLIELLVTIAITGVLLALILPAVQSVRESSRRTVCKNHLKQLGLALHNYHEEHSVLPPGSISQGPSITLFTGWGWGAMILPQIEQTALYDQIDFNRGNLVGGNIALVQQPVSIWYCPSDVVAEKLQISIPDENQFLVAAGNYLGNSNMLDAISSVRFSSVRDGLSQTLMLGERVYQPGLPEFPVDTQFTSSWCGVLHTETSQVYNSIAYITPLSLSSVNGPYLSPDSFTSRHSGGVHFTLADGSVRLISDSIDSSVFRGLGTIDEGEVISSF